MERKGWIEHVFVNDRRERGFRLTAPVRRLMTVAKPGWKRAQNRLRSAVSVEQWEAMWHALRIMSNGAFTAQNTTNEVREVRASADGQVPCSYLRSAALLAEMTGKVLSKLEAGSQ
jgi:hypothetical protein